MIDSYSISYISLFRLDGGSYRLESGVSAREYPMCDDSFTTRVATTIQGYKKVRMKKISKLLFQDAFNR